MDNTPDTILFFDGVCNLCNGFIDFLVKRDSRAKIKFAPLQSDVAKKLVPKESEALTSLVFYKKGSTYTESTAALLTLAELGGLWPILKLLLIFPKFIRNPVYRLIARNRYKWFGKQDTCRLPSPEEKERFLS